MKTVIVTRHSGALEWLRKYHSELFETTYQEDPAVDLEVVEPIVISHADPVGVTGNRVIGTLPNRLSCLAAEYYEIDLPGLPAEARGKELSCEEMEKYGARLVRYVVLDGHHIDLLRNVVNGCNEANPGVLGAEELGEKSREVA